MGTGQSSEVTALLRAWAAGDESALERLAPAVYSELRRRAQSYMLRESPEHTLQATALAHEAWIRLVDVSAVDWRDRAHFFAIAAQMMRRILVDSARARKTGKRGGLARRVNLEQVAEFSGRQGREIIAVDDALEVLEKMDWRKAKVVELRFFGGLSVQETAAVLKVSEQTVLRDWRLARIWLLREVTRQMVQTND